MSQKNSFSIFNENNVDESNNQTYSMDLDSEHINPNIIVNEPPPPIFILIVNYFSSFYANIKKVNKD